MGRTQFYLQNLDGREKQLLCCYLVPEGAKTTGIFPGKALLRDPLCDHVGALFGMGWEQLVAMASDEAC